MQGVQEQVSGRKSKLHWDLRHRTTSLAVFVFGVVALQSPTAVGMAWLAALVASTLMGVPKRILLARYALAGPLLALMVIPLLIPFSQDRLVFALLIVGKAGTSITVLTSLVHTQPLERLLAAFQQMRLPASFVTVMFLTYRYLFVIGDELSKTHRSMTARLFQPKTNLRTMGILGEMTGGMFLRAFDRSGNIYRAMASRGFNGCFPAGRSPRTTVVDWVQSAIALGLIVSLLIADRWWFS